MNRELSTATQFVSYEMMVFGDLVPKEMAQGIVQTRMNEVSRASGDESVSVYQGSFPDLVVLSDSLGCPWHDHIYSLLRLRDHGYSGRAVVITDTPSYDELRYALDNGISDYIYASSCIDLEFELERITTAPRKRGPMHGDEMIRQMAIFRSLGLSSGQIELLVAYASSFGRLNELAEYLDKTEDQLRKAFSRIYDKLRGPLSIDCPARMAHLLTLCLRVP